MIKRVNITGSDTTKIQHSCFSSFQSIVLYFHNSSGDFPPFMIPVNKNRVFFLKDDD